MPRSSYDPRIQTFRELPKVTEIDGIDIHIDGADGSFWAKVGNDVMSRKSLADLKRVIAGRARPAKLLVIDGANSSWTTPSIKTVEVVGVEKKSHAESFGDNRQYRLATGETLGVGRTDIYPYDAETEARFTSLEQEHEAARKEHYAFLNDWRERWRAEVAKLQRLTPDEVKELRDRAKAEGE